MGAWVVTILLMISYVAVEYFGTEKDKRNDRLKVKVTIAIIFMLLVKVVGTIDSNLKQNKFEKEVKLRMLDELQDNCRVIYTWRTCLNNNWAPRKNIVTKMNTFEYLNLIGDLSLRNKINDTYNTILEAKERIEVFQDGKGFLSEEELNNAKKYLDLCLKQQKESIIGLSRDLFGVKHKIEREFQLSFDLSDQQVIGDYMPPGSYASGPVVAVEPFFNIDEQKEKAVGKDDIIEVIK